MTEKLVNPAAEQLISHFSDDPEKIYNAAIAICLIQQARQGVNICEPLEKLQRLLEELGISV